MTSLPGETTVADLQRKGLSILREAGIAEPGPDVRILLAHVLGVERGAIVSMGSSAVEPQQAELFLSLVDERRSGRPVHRIVGSREFFGRSFEFDEHCLEPRPETELLVERVLEDFPRDRKCRFAEIGAGSGIICVTLLCEAEGFSALATDISRGALEATRRNALAHSVAGRLELQQADCLTGVEGQFDFIVSNPPYIPSGDLAGLSHEVVEHDPAAALDGGADGYDIYRRILDQAKRHLADGGLLYLETGHGQHDDLCRMAVENGWGIVSRHLDLCDLERIVVFKR